ncbi:D-arabinono-1,4-lactone oxidase [Verticillium alfalfae VaMs.102]|uniref:D-arabinono-1,4-lactone oxidase n=1 Tax=Verticillium alfalfae (strain VaMs.102 / ATCC MYA-4576 / FGSC 10136) TaxID=526221 RepID=C9SBJ4_VERA1|nr:D-arabinono-1,4-lactone oxidase [Verticillium alfalfae VaMs.102]EEY15728.1 D-arabinono-1,4-lactone oxidase [Verticillium alfalfae VaMs.102]
MDSQLVAALAKSDPEVAFRARPNHIHSTWAKTFSSLPELYIQPESLEEVEKVIDLARTCRRRIVLTGCGHSPSNITCTSSWLVNLDNFNKVLSINEETGVVVMQSGIRLYSLCAHLQKHGHRHGSQHVRSLDRRPLDALRVCSRLVVPLHAARGRSGRPTRRTSRCARPPCATTMAPSAYYIYHNLLYLAHHVPRVLPWVEWFVFGMQYGFANGSTTTAVQPSGKALLHETALYSQFGNEWGPSPLHKGPEALRRLSSWLNHLDPADPDYVPHNIPFSADGLYVHAPRRVRVSDTFPSPRNVLGGGDRLALEEVEIARTAARDGGVRVEGTV